jgi:3-hydroxyacyl-CoA dehydrogenase
MTAQYKVHGNVAIITLDNPPVNGLGLATRQGITDGLALANYWRWQGVFRWRRHQRIW